VPTLGSAASGSARSKPEPWKSCAIRRPAWTTEGGPPVRDHDDSRPPPFAFRRGEVSGHLSRYRDHDFGHGQTQTRPANSLKIDTEPSVALEPTTDDEPRGSMVIASGQRSRYPTRSLRTVNCLTSAIRSKSLSTCTTPSPW
jgi:hypothetical protein